MEIRKLNMLRGIAAMIVVVSHFSNTTKMLGGILGIRRANWALCSSSS